MSCPSAGSMSANRSNVQSMSDTANGASGDSGCGRQLSQQEDQAFSRMMQHSAQRSTCGGANGETSRNGGGAASDGNTGNDVGRNNGRGRFSDNASASPTDTTASSQPSPMSQPQPTSTVNGTGKASGSTAGSAAGNDPTGMVAEINRVRAQNGLGPVTVDNGLNQAAARNDAESVRSGQLGHHFGVPNGADGEITASASSGETAKQAVDQWLNSPGHRAILLDPNQTKVGVSINGEYATADFK